MTLISSRIWPLWRYGATLLIAGFLFYLARHNELALLDLARANYVQESQLASRNASDRLTEKLDILYLDLRTIAQLPFVRGIDRYASNFSFNARRTVQQIYDALTQNVLVSEIYIVPADLNPDVIDPKTGALDTPSIQFDSHITNAPSLISAANPLESQSGPISNIMHEKPDVEEIEIYEYRAMRDQIAYFREHYPKENMVPPDSRVALSSPELVTCDNSEYSSDRPNDSDRKGVVYSVPFYNDTGELAGLLSAVIRSKNLARMIPAGQYILYNAGLHYSIGQQTFSNWRDFLKLSEARSPDPKVIYSETFALKPVDKTDGWALWAMRDDDDFHQRADVKLAHVVARISYGVIGAIMLMVLIALYAQSWQLDKRRKLNIELERRIDERTADLQLAIKSANAASEAKSSFLAMMSHEIRTPINGIMGMAGVLEDSPLNDEQKRNVAIIRNSVDALLRIINDILDFSKLEAGAFELEAIDFNLHDVIHYAIEILMPRARARGIGLRAVIDPDVPPHVRADAGRVQQVLLNLVGNALKFTEKGEVVVHVELLDERESSASIRISVRDTGIGIPPDKIGRLFQSFSQTDASISRRFGGTGLGLAISKRLVELMGGTIGVTSQEGVGSTFALEIPVQKSTGRAAAEHAASKSGTAALEADLKRIETLGRSIRLLLVEDNLTNQIVAKSILERKGITPDIANNGVEALSLARQILYDVILMDVHMPEMGGLEATRGIRSMSKPFGEVPIIALTANAFGEEIRACMDAGMNKFLGKPFKKEDLFRAIADVLPVNLDAQPAAGGEDQSMPALQHELDALIADFGEETFRSLLDIYLKEAADLLMQMRTLVGERNGIAEARRLVHSLKSASAQVGAHELSRRAADLESEFASEKRPANQNDLDDLSELFQSYQKTLTARGLAIAQAQ